MGKGKRNRANPRRGTSQSAARSTTRSPGRFRDRSAPLTERERFAQRRLIGVIRAGGELSEHGLEIWRKEAHKPELFEAAGATEVTDCLDELGIPYEVALSRRRVWEMGRSYKPLKAGYAIRIAFSDLDYVTQWMPSLQRSIDALAARLNCPDDGDHDESGGDRDDHGEATTTATASH